MPKDGRRRAKWVVREVDAWNSALCYTDRREKYARMKASAFRFYRGTNHLYWHDFARDPRLRDLGNRWTRTWLQGDCHAENFGAFFDNDPDHSIIFGLNDFDEAVIGDYQLDLWRLAVSAVLVARQNGAFGRRKQRRGIDALAASYLATLRDFRRDPQSARRVFTKENTYGLLDDFLVEVERENSRKKELRKWTRGDKRVRFDFSEERLGSVTVQEREAIIAAMPAYGRTLCGGTPWDPEFFRVKDVARRLYAGTGSLGTRRFYVLIQGASSARKDDHILDFKMQRKPTAYRYMSRDWRRRYDNRFENDAQRQVVAVHSLTAHLDDLLGWVALPDGVYTVRERSPYKETLASDRLDTATRFRKLAEQWARVLATHHCYGVVSLDRAGSLPGQLDKLKGREAEFAARVREVAFGYADQVERDWRAFKSALGTDIPDLRE